jgi:hypothetical protein
MVNGLASFPLLKILGGSGKAARSGIGRAPNHLGIIGTVGATSICLFLSAFISLNS